jgi:hypothetical protein
MSDPVASDKPTPKDPPEKKPETAPPAFAEGSADNAEKPKRSRGQRWRRRAIWVLLIGVGLIVALRLTVRWTLPAALSKAAAPYDLDVRYDRLQFHMLGGDIGLWNVRIVPHGAPDDAEAILHADYVRGDISILALLKGRLHVLRAEVDAADMLLERTADGRIPLLDRLNALPPSPPMTKIDFTPPLVVEALRLHKVKTRVRDAYVSPPTDQILWLDLRLSDLGTPGGKARFEADAWAEGLLDSMHAAGDAQLGGQSLDASAEISMRGLRPKAVAKYLETLGVHPVADTISVEMSLVTRARPLGTPTSAPLAASSQAPAGRPDAVTASIAVDDLRIAANERDAVKVAKLGAEIAELTPTSARISKVMLDGVRVSGSRSSQSRLGAAGFELAAPQATTQPSTQPATVVAKAKGSTATPSPPAAASGAAPAAAPFALTIAEVDVRDVDATFRDDGVVPSTDLRLIARELRLKAKEGTNALSPDATLAVVGRLELPGVARLVSIDGEVRPQARERTAELKLHAEGIRPEALRPYLDAAGIQSLMNDADARATVRASVAPGAEERGGGIIANARLSDVTLTDGAELLTFGGVNVKNAAVNSAGTRLSVELIELDGPSFEVRRKADGAIEAAGVRLAARKPAAAPGQAPSPTSQPSAAVAAAGEAPATQPAVSLPQVEIGRLTWKNVRLKLTDESAASPETFEIGDAGIEVSDLLVDLQNRAATQPGKQGTLKVWLAAPQLADELKLEGTLTPGSGALAADLRVTGRGVDLTRIAAYLKPLGIEPVLKQGTLDAVIKADVSSDADRMRATLDVSGVKLADGERELVALDGLRVTGAEKTAEGVGVGAIEVTKPRIAVTREANGAFVAAGIRVLPTTRPAQAQAAPAPPTTAPSGVAAATQPAPAPAAMTVALNKLVVDGAELQWEDQMVKPAVRFNASASVNVDQVVLGKPAAPANFEVTLAAKDALEEMKLNGTVDLTPGAPAAKLHVAGRGMRAGPLAPYLPPGTEVSLVDGRLVADLDAAITPNEAGGQTFKLNVTNVDYRDAAASASAAAADGAPDAPPLLALKEFKIAAPRIDLAGDVIAIDEVSLTGFETRAGKDKDGATRALGLILRPPPEGAAASAEGAEGAAATTQPAAVPIPAAPTTGPATAPVTDQEVARLVAAARRPLPLVTLGKLDINASRIEWSDASRPGSKPVVVRDLRLRNVDPVSVGGPKAETQPPVKIELTTAIDPLTPNVTLTAEAAPFAMEPTAKLDLTARGITGRAVTDLFPDLASKIDGSGMTDGRFRTAVQALAKYDRRGPRDFDISRGIQLDVEVKGLALTNGEKGPVLAGVESLQCDALRIEPKTGVVHAKVLEVNKPMATASRDAAGVHLLGLVIKPPAAAATQPTAEKAKPDEPPAKPEPATAPVATSATPKSEIRVDRLLITGIDVRFEDTTAEPALVVPLNNLDVEVRGFTTLALSEPRPIRFSAVVGADKVPLRKQTKGAGVAGAVGDVASLIGGKKKEEMTNVAEVEQRELFSQITAAGNLTLYPAPAGYVKSSVSGLELAALAGPASQAGVNLSGGVFDTTVEAYFRDDGSLDTRSRFVFTDLSVQEPPNGPIARHLALPAPLDVVLGALRDTDGSITVPLNVPIEKGKVNKGVVTSSAVGALGSIIATAIASAPVKAVQDVGQLVGLGSLFGGDKQKEIQPVELVFGTGDVMLAPSEQQKLAGLIEQMRKDETIELTGRHELGGGDLDLARGRANPDPLDALALARAVQARKQQLITARTDLATRARVELASLPTSDGQAAATLDELRALDRQIAAADDGSDALFDLLRPGAERQADRRARAAALQVAQQRLAEVRDAAVGAAKASNVPLATERIRMTNPQFNPSDDLPAGGRVVVTVVRKKRQ